VSSTQSPPFLISDLCELIETYLDAASVQEVYHAYLLGAEAHEGQHRQSGEPYIYHPIEVARILAEMRMDGPTLAAAILHDVMEDTPIPKAQIRAQFGEQVADLVDGVSKLKQIDFESKAEAQAASFRKMILAMTKDIRVILLKLADRLHNMRTLGAKNSDSRRRIARETLEIYAPIACRLGISNMARELEDLGLAALYPQRYRVLRQKAEEFCQFKKHKEVVSTVEQALKRRLEQEGIEAEIVGRRKHTYGIYQKMKEKGGKLKEVLDMVGFRIIVDKEDTCYRVLGMVHGLYKPRPGSFKDYIAIPKANGYQSLHTTLKGPQGLPLEVQIRTYDMHVFAEYGIAAHGLYKSGDDGRRQRTGEWLRRLLDLQNNVSNAVEFLEHVKMDLFPDEVYVFTPKGKIVELPRGATTLDFAYAVHTAVGNAAIRARIDGELVPLSTVLHNGQSVEVITTDWARPHLDWLNFVVTAKARSNIRAHLKLQRTDQAVLLGRRMLDRELDRHGLSLDTLSEAQHNALLSTFQCSSLNALLEDIGTGNRLAFAVARQLAPQEQDNERHMLAGGNSKPLIIKGTEGMLVTLAKCCHPIPGDPIKGYVSAGKGIMVHTDQCKNVAEHRSRTASWIDLRWADHLENEFSVTIRIKVFNERGVLATVAAAIANLGVNIEDIASEEKDGFYTTLNFGIAVRERKHLALIIRKLRRLAVVSRIQRI
jgi:RelA/SpoT family (p)ppGpp synthetase